MTHLTHHTGTSRRRKAGLTMIALVAAATACAEQETPTGAAGTGVERAAASPSAVVNPIVPEPLTQRHAFTDDVAIQIRVKPDGRPTEVINVKDATHMAVVKFTIQPGARFPWHSHPGLVTVAVTQGSLTFVYADDCVERPYPVGTAFVDPGFGNVHYAFNPTAGETVVVATFFGVPPAPAGLSNVVDAETEAALNEKCQVASVMARYN